MPIPNDNPITVPAKTFPEWYITTLTTLAANPNTPPVLSVTYAPLRRDENGVGEYGPGARTHTIPDLWSKLVSDPVAAAIYASLVDYITADAKAAGVI